MKRDPALVSLSRDHHRALAVARNLRRATTKTTPDARADALSFWWTAGRAHFRVEEEVLLLDERELFVLIEQALPAPQLAALSAALATAEERTIDG